MTRKAKDDHWKCPQCGSMPETHGKGGPEACRTDPGSKFCSGFLCECESDGSDTHGTPEDPCTNAVCYHCGWDGEFPPRPKKLKGWAKTAWDAGWRPPGGWQ